MRLDWIDHCIRLSKKPAEFFSGCRKIHRAVKLEFETLGDELRFEDAGYTSAKMRYLERQYLHQESLDVAVKLWDRRRVQAKYGSVGFTTYNHFIKNDPDKKSKRASVMGPCIQSVVITWLSKTEYSVDVFYRTTELFKKFPADLVFLRDVLLKPFQFDGMTMRVMNCHFANVTIHPMYFVTIVPLMTNPIAALEELKARDRYFFDWVVKWTARYVCPEYHRGIAKFAQAMRVHRDAKKRIAPDTMKRLQRYLKDNHPGYRNDYEDPDNEDD